MCDFVSHQNKKLWGGMVLAVLSGDGLGWLCERIQMLHCII
jgi:hypothetical protein